MSVDDASALQDTLARLRQRYTLNFYLSGEQAQGQHSVRVDLSEEARIRFSDAEVRSRRVFMSGVASESSGPTVVSHQTAPEYPEPASEGNQPASNQRRVAVSGDASGADAGPGPD
jgi:hypothetical protein